MDDFDSLRICSHCDCRLCFESAAEPLTPDSWLVVLQCPNCWHAWSTTVSDVALELLEHALDDDMRVIAAAAEEMALATAFAEAELLSAEVARFAAALEADAILPMDF
jgi:hypothetical protein